MFVGIYLGTATGLNHSLLSIWLQGYSLHRLSRPLTITMRYYIALSQFNE
jgi:hypothetical protein